MNRTIYLEMMMNTISANEAKTHFGDLLLNAQKSPVQISKNGKPVAVVISVDDYESIEALKLHLLQNKAAQAMKDISKGDLVAGEAFFSELEEGLYD